MGGAEAIWGVVNGGFAASMGTVGRGGQIRQFHRHVVVRMGDFNEGAQRFWLGARGRGEKVSITLVSIGTIGSSEFFDVGCSTSYFSVKKYGGGHYDVSMLLD